MTKKLPDFAKLGRKKHPQERAYEKLIVQNVPSRHYMGSSVPRSGPFSSPTSSPKEKS